MLYNKNFFTRINNVLFLFIYNFFFLIFLSFPFSHNMLIHGNRT